MGDSAVGNGDFSENEGKGDSRTERMIFEHMPGFRKISQSEQPSVDKANLLWKQENGPIEDAFRGC